MRRRVWYHLQYYDVLLSLEHGLPPVIHEDTYSISHPTNVTDDEFDEDSKIIFSSLATETYAALPCTHHLPRPWFQDLQLQGRPFPQVAARDMVQIDSTLPPRAFCQEYLLDKHYLCGFAPCPIPAHLQHRNRANISSLPQYHDP
ncbi:hypothetical protein LB505_007313 [Fusarium chuoi]|nr:hypothetical protein LB505_007313 [Fusarium chuoi]